MATSLRHGRLWPPLPLVLGFLLIALLANGYRSCRDAAALALPGTLANRLTPPPPDFRTIGLSDGQTFGLSDFQMVRLSDFLTFRRSGFQKVLTKLRLSASKVRQH